MESFEVVPFGEEDLGPLTALWNEVFRGAYKHGEVDEASLRSLTLGCSQFDREGSFVARAEGRPIGAVFSYGAREFENDLYWHMIVAGWIGAVFVAPEWRRRGMGSRLLREAEGYHQRRGRLLVFAGGGEGVATPFHGVEDGWEEARGFFRARGYRWVRRTCAVNIDLARYQSPESVRRKEEALAAQGVEVRLGEPGDAEPYRTYLQELGSADWPETFERWLARPDRTVLALLGDRVVGDCRGIHVDAQGRAGYGNIVTHPEFRNRGIGTVMLARAVERARQLGGTSMPLWTRPKTAERFYVKLGFEVVRNFDTFGTVLRQDLLSEAWIARHRYL